MEAHKDGKTGEDQLHNVAYFIDDGGKILGRYQKKNLWYSFGLIQYAPSVLLSSLNCVLTIIGPTEGIPSVPI